MFKSLLKHFKKLDWLLIITTFLLVGMGLLAIYNSSLGKENFLNFKKQIIFFLIGFGLMILLSYFDWRIIKNDPYLILILYFICLLSLIGLFFFAPEIRGIKSWYRAGPLSIGPIEFIKIVLIILLAKYFSTRHIEMYQIRHLLLSGIYALLPILLIFFQPDLGSVIILFFIWLGIVIVAGIKIKHLFLLFFLIFLVGILCWSFLLKDYQKQRIISFLNPQIDPKGISWSVNQSKIAIGSGRIFGRGLNQGWQAQYGFLPESQTDFIFAAIAEESGLLGVIILFFLYLILLWRVTKIALFSESNFPRLFATGFNIFLMSQIFINVGMNLGILPIIGIPLPLVSYGGSSLIAVFLGLGILQSIKRTL